MPAIDLTKLKQQSAELVLFYDQPDTFLKQFKDILEFYTNRTLRVNQVIQKSNLPTYNTPRPVLFQIENAIEKLGDQYPDAAIKLTKALWDASFYEAQLLSAFILGTIPPALTISLLTSLPEKLYNTKDQGVKNALLTSSFARLRIENPQTMMLLIREWLNAPGQKTQTWGLFAFLPFVEQLGFDDLPQVFEILRPAIEGITPITQTDIQACINTTYRISPVETIHFLTDIFQNTKDQQVLRIFMRLIRGLPMEAQKNLGSIIKNITNPLPEPN
jgi:hypothetical protein